MNPETLLATLVLKAMASWDKAKADEYTRINNEAIENGGYPIMDYRYCYGKSVYEAAHEACKDNFDLSEPVYYLLSNSWNDAHDWANRLLNSGK